MPGSRRGAKGSVLYIDIGTSSLKFLEAARTSQGPSVKNLHIEEFPPEIQEKDSLEKEYLVQCIKESLSKSGIKTSPCVVILPDYITNLVLLTLPKQTKEELKTSMKWELKDRIGVPIDDAVYDYCILEDEAARQVFLAAAISRKEITGYLDILKAAGLEPVSLSIGITSFLPLVKKSGLVEKGEEFAVLDFGAKTSKLGVYKGDVLRFYRMMNIGGRHITLSLMDENTDFNKAEAIKKSSGISAAGMEEEGISESEAEASQRNFGLARSVLERIVSELGQNIGLYKESMKGGEVKKLFIFGGGARLKGLKPFLSSALGLSVYSPDPFADLKISADSHLFSRAWGTFIKEAEDINLLPEEVKLRGKIRIMNLLARMAACAVTILLLLGYSGVILSGKGLLREVSSKQREFEALSPSLEKINKLEEGRAVLQKRMDLCVRLLEKDPFWEDILKEIGRIIPDNTILTKMNISKAEGQKKEDFFTGGTAKQDEGVILTLEGSVYQGEITLERTLSNFLKDLSESPFFYDTKLNISKENKTDDKTILDFIIQSRIRID